jgi:hypothetical protein
MNWALDELENESVNLSGNRSLSSKSLYMTGPIHSKGCIRVKSSIKLGNFWQFRANPSTLFAAGRKHGNPTGACGNAYATSCAVSPDISGTFCTYCTWRMGGRREPRRCRRTARSRRLGVDTSSVQPVTGIRPSAPASESELKFALQPPFRWC